MRKKLQNIWFRLFSKRILRKIENDRSYCYGSLEIAMEPGVFHPKYFDSSQMLLEWVEANNLDQKNVVEVGCGSGITSLRAAQKGAHVWAIDINRQAVKLIKENAASNHVSVNALASDLFVAVPKIAFDFVLINPPFYPKNPTTAAEQAWFCGEGFEYFIRLFEQLKERDIFTGIFMTLSDGCDLEKIQSIAKQQGYLFELKGTKKSFFEKNFLFEVLSEELSERC
ncbi:MAG: hypothetical protein Crog4KO_17220 [Crocinitomicaceae bacterium]